MQQHALPLLAAALLPACAGEVDRARPRVWIAAPLNGSHHELGTIPVMSHSSCETGIQEGVCGIVGEDDGPIFVDAQHRVRVLGWEFRQILDFPLRLLALGDVLCRMDYLLHFSGFIFYR